MRARLHRRALLRWVAAAGLALASVAGVSNELSRARAARQQWGATVEVALLTRSIEAGTTISADDLRWSAVPTGVVPEGALTRAVDLSGGRAQVDLVAGEILVESRLTSQRGAVASMLPPDTIGVGIARYDDPLPLMVGDRVDIIDVGDAGSGVRATVLLRRGLVVAVDDAGATVAVPFAVVRAVAEGAARGSVVLGLSG